MRIIKKISILLCLCLSLSFLPTQYWPTFHTTDTVEAATLNLNVSSKKLYIDEKYTLKVKGSKKYVMWRSSNKKIASVSSKGVVTAKKTGIATITATVGAGSSGKKLKCKITVLSRLSVKNNVIRCYPDQYQQIKIKANKLKSNEVFGLEYEANNVAVGKLYKKSNYYNLIVEPDGLGHTQLVVRIYKQDNIFPTAQNDSITFDIFSYPDKSGWISADDLDAFGISIIDCLDGTFGVLCSNTSSGGFVTDARTLDPACDKQTGTNTYVNDGLRYKIQGRQVYLSTTDMEKLYF